MSMMGMTPQIKAALTIYEVMTADDKRKHLIQIKNAMLILKSKDEKKKLKEFDEYEEEVDKVLMMLERKVGFINIKGKSISSKNINRYFSGIEKKCLSVADEVLNNAGLMPMGNTGVSEEDKNLINDFVGEVNDVPDETG